MELGKKPLPFPGYPVKNSDEIAAAKAMITPQEMNILSGQFRIGTETKEKHLTRLADLFARGYLTREEWEARQSWVLKARTQEEIEVAFLDLPAFINVPVPQKNPWEGKAVSRVMAFLYIIIGVASLVSVGGDIPQMMYVCAPLFMLVTLLTFSNQRRTLMKGKKK